MSTVLSFSLSYLWGMINCLQMIVYMPLFSIVIPANLAMVMDLLITIATFDVIPEIDWVLEDFLFSF